MKILVEPYPIEAANAVSFTDDVNADKRRLSSERPVSISAKVKPEKRLDWYYELLKLFGPSDREVKSKDVVPIFLALSKRDQAAIFDSLKEVQINIADSLPYEKRTHEMAVRLIGREDAIKEIRERAAAGDKYSIQLRELLNNHTAERILFDSPARKLSWNIHFNRYVSFGYGLGNALGPSDPPWQPTSLLEFQSELKGAIVGTVTQYVSKSASVFSEPIDHTYEYYPWMWHDPRNAVYGALKDEHAFDTGNSGPVRIMEQERRQIATQLTPYEPWYDDEDLPPYHGEVDSNDSYFVQAADIAAGIARYYYELGAVSEIRRRFDYVMFNGDRVTQDNADEIMDDWRRKGYIPI